MTSKSIPKDVRQRAEETVDRFNDEHFADADVRYVARFRGAYLYLDRHDYGNTGPICRLKYTGNFKEWAFAIFKYSSEQYNPDEWFFPGDDKVDGTIEGAMLAGLEAYPP